MTATCDGEEPRPRKPAWRRCDNCSHWQPTLVHHGDYLFGDCRKRAPHRKSRKSAAAVWPQTAADKGCGDIERLDAPGKKD